MIAAGREGKRRGAARLSCEIVVVGRGAGLHANGIKAINCHHSEFGNDDFISFKKYLIKLFFTQAKKNRPAAIQV